MTKIIQPADSPKPASAYANGILVPGGGERLLIAGQVGVTADGTTLEGLEAQCEQAWRNVLAIVREAGFQPTDIVRVFAYVTIPGQAGVYRAVRDRMLGGHLCASTYLEVAGLASPQWLCEIEAEAQRA